MISDSIKSDKVGANNFEIDCYIVDREHSIRDLLQMIVNSKKDVIHLVRKRQCNLHLWEYVFYKILKICSKVKKLIGIVC